MSYWVSLEIATGAPEYHEVYSANYTSNCSAMWKLADPVGVGIKRLHNQNAKVAASILRQMINKMMESPATFKKLSPSNGWGDFDNQLQFLHDLMNKCREHHLCTVKVHN